MEFHYVKSDNNITYPVLTVSDVNIPLTEQSCSVKTDHPLIDTFINEILIPAFVGTIKDFMITELDELLSESFSSIVNQFLGPQIIPGTDVLLSLDIARNILIVEEGNLLIPLRVRFI